MPPCWRILPLATIPECEGDGYVLARALRLIGVRVSGRAGPAIVCGTDFLYLNAPLFPNDYFEYFCRPATRWGVAIG